MLPTYIFIGKREYSGLIDGLASTTNEFIKAALHNSTDRPTSSQGPLPVTLMPALLGWSIAQRVNRRISIETSIEYVLPSYFSDYHLMPISRVGRYRE